MKRLKEFSGKKSFYVLGVFAVFLVLMAILYFETGTLGDSDIDDKDLAFWEYEDGVIVNAEAFELEGEREACWIVIHGYTDTPDSMREISEKVNSEFGDYVYAPRLLGHGEVPSELLDYTLDDWYAQVSSDFDYMSESCEKINVLGFSFGGALSLRLAEEKAVNNVYLIAPYLEPTDKWYYGFETDEYLETFSESMVYVKRLSLPMVNSREWAEGYISYWSFVLPPIERSSKFLEILKRDVSKVNEPILIQHSCGDAAASCEMSEYVYSGVSSEIKEIVLYEDSNHVILADYDKFDVIDKVVEFERANRG